MLMWLSMDAQNYTIKNDVIIFSDSVSVLNPLGSTENAFVGTYTPHGGKKRGKVFNETLLFSFIAVTPSLAIHIPKMPLPVYSLGNIFAISLAFLKHYAYICHSSKGGRPCR